MAVRRYNPGYMPPATLTLVALNIGVSVVDIMLGGYLERLFWGRGIDIQYGDYWRIFSCAWVHGSILHVGFNAYGLYILGSIVERMQGRTALLMIYFVALFGGSGLALSFMDPQVPLVGASGAVFGLFGAVLGWVYAKTGSLKEMTKIPFARMLLFWLGLNIFISLAPGISLLGHLGGFVPGVVLGIFFEHRYRKELDIYHRVAAGAVTIAAVALCIFACFPITRASWYGAQALRAYENDDYERGDELRAEAKSRRGGNEGTSNLLTHLRLWREKHESQPNKYTKEVLRYPLTHPNFVDVPEAEQLPFTFLIPTDEAESLESGDGAP